MNDLFTPANGYWVKAFQRHADFYNWLNSDREDYKPVEYCTYEFRCRHCGFLRDHAELDMGYHEAVLHQMNNTDHLVEGREQDSSKWRRLEERD
jgi:hypothetical protein